MPTTSSPICATKVAWSSPVPWADATAAHCSSESCSACANVVAKVWGLSPRDAMRIRRSKGPSSPAMRRTTIIRSCRTASLTDDPPAFLLGAPAPDPFLLPHPEGVLEAGLLHG